STFVVISIGEMNIWRLTVCSFWSRYTLCTIGTFPLSPLISSRVVAICCGEIYVHTDICFILVCLTKTTAGCIISISDMRVLCLTVSALWSLDTLVSFRALQALDTLRTSVSFGASLTHFRNGIASFASIVRVRPNRL